MSRYPEDLSYSSEHEWLRGGNGTTMRVGITGYAAEQLGDIVNVTLPTVGEEVARGDACGELETTKSVAEVFTPVSGVVSAVNAALTDSPEVVNADPYGDGWLFEIEVSDPDEAGDLMDAAAYAEHVGE